MKKKGIYYILTKKCNTKRIITKTFGIRCLDEFSKFLTITEIKTLHLMYISVLHILIMFLLVNSANSESVCDIYKQEQKRPSPWFVSEQKIFSLFSFRSWKHFEMVIYIGDSFCHSLTDICLIRWSKDFY